MQEKFIVEIITPDRSLLKSEASEVIIPSYEGEMGILKDHIPLITFLRPGLITIKSDKVQKFYAEEGTVEFSKNNLLILTTTVKTIDDIEAQLFAYHVAILKGTDIDQPRNLAKSVTVE